MISTSGVAPARADGFWDLRGIVGVGRHPQHMADRLDPEAVPPSFDVGGHLRRAGSSSPAKYRLGSLKIRLARRSSAFSRRSRRSSSRSLVEALGPLAPVGLRLPRIQTQDLAVDPIRRDMRDRPLRLPHLPHRPLQQLRRVLPWSGHDPGFPLTRRCAPGSGASLPGAVHRLPKHRHDLLRGRPLTPTRRRHQTLNSLA